MPRTSTEAMTRHIAIIGGGTAGWMAAAMLSRATGAQQCQITIVDDESGGVGVGEATIPSILRLVRMLGGDEAGFMQACDATWKLGIQFSDWKAGKDIWHPFGVCGAQIDGRDLFPFWLAQLSRSEKRLRPYHGHSLHWSAALAGKAPHGRSRLSPIAATGSYAYHLNAEGLAGWLQQHAMQAGCQHIAQRVQHAVRADDGCVQHVRLSDGSLLSADFFIDCSGFEPVLQDHPDSVWQSWGNELLCDAAVVLRLPPAAIVPVHTRATALSAGWCWDIPLITRRGLGYVFSTQFQSAEDATNELLQFAGLPQDMIATLEPRVMSLQTGRRANFWVGNVLSLGLAAGFAEPLESSGLHLTQVGIEKFLQLFPAEPSERVLQTAYNQAMTVVFDEVRDFVQLHYHLNDRTAENDPTGFWTAAREASLSDPLRHRLKLYEEVGELPLLSPDAFGETSYFHLLAGSGRLPSRPPAAALGAEGKQLEQILTAIIEQNRAALRDLPMHEESLRHVHPTAFAKAS